MGLREGRDAPRKLRLGFPAALLALWVLCPVPCPAEDTAPEFQVGPMEDNGTVAVGDPAPPMRVTDAAGIPVETARPPGTPMLLDFGSIRCQDCVNAAGYLEDLRSRFSGLGLTVVMVSVDPFVTPERAGAFLREKGLGFEILHDVEGATAESYGVTLIPSQFLVDGEGVIRAIHVGFEEGMIPEGMIEGLLPPSTPTLPGCCGVAD